MAGNPVSIADMSEALRTGAVPGGFSADRTVYTFPTLRYLNSRGARMLWTVSVRLDRRGAGVPIEEEMLRPGAVLAPGLAAVIGVESLQEGGKVRPAKPTRVAAGKNLGKRNATNPLTQALRDALGLYNRHLRHVGQAEGGPRGPEGPRASRETPPPAEGGPRRGPPAPSARGAFDPAPPPMLVKTPGATREAALTPADFAAGVVVQRKFNGVHLVAHAAGGRVVFYSRTSSAYPGLRQLAAELLPMLERAPPAGPEFGVPEGAGGLAAREAYAAPGAAYLDGELYLHGRSLNWISGQARKDADEGSLEFHVFDAFFPRAKAAGHDMPSWGRQAYLDALFREADAAGLPHPHVARVQNFAAASMGEVEDLARRFVREGYEGAVARRRDYGYRYSYNNYHSPAVLKFKPKYDDEFPVVGFTQGTKGKAVGALIWICEVPSPVDPRDRTFSVVPKDMTDDQRRRLYRCLSAEVPDPADPAARVTRFERDVKGLPLTVAFAEISAKTGKPLQAKALAFRTYEGGPEKDPIRRLLSECEREAGAGE